MVNVGKYNIITLILWEYRHSYVEDYFDIILMTILLLKKNSSPEMNERPLKRDHFKTTELFSNPHFSKDMLVFRGVIC